jgi:hypothetical protein
MIPARHPDQRDDPGKAPGPKERSRQGTRAQEMIPEGSKSGSPRSVLPQSGRFDRGNRDPPAQSTPEGSHIKPVFPYPLCDPFRVVPAFRLPSGGFPSFALRAPESQPPATLLDPSGISLVRPRRHEKNARTIEKIPRPQGMIPARHQGPRNDLRITPEKRPDRFPPTGISSSRNDRRS